MTWVCVWEFSLLLGPLQRLIECVHRMAAMVVMAAVPALAQVFVVYIMPTLPTLDSLAQSIRAQH